jgi:chaperonin GroES
VATKLNPVGPRIVAQREEASKKTASGIYLPDSAQEKPQFAKVLAVGPNVMVIKKGDRIIYGEYKATELKIDGEEFIVVDEQDVLATVV